MKNSVSRVSRQLQPVVIRAIEKAHYLFTEEELETLSTAIALSVAEFLGERRMKHWNVKKALTIRLVKEPYLVRPYWRAVSSDGMHSIKTPYGPELSAENIKHDLEMEYPDLEFLVEP